jgi:ATP-dependent DNA helicase HFM1/MER3
MKALCSERYEDWSKKFGPVGMTCKELTGDSEMDDYFELQSANIVMTTPVSNVCLLVSHRDHVF